MVEIIPKPAKKTPFWQIALVFLSIIFLLACVASFFVLNFFIKNSEKNIADLELTLTKEKTPSEAALEKEVLNYQKKIEDAVLLLNSHLYPSQLFDFLQENTHPKVWFSNIELNVEEYKVKISGITDSFQFLGEQAIVFKGTPLIKNLNLTEISIKREGEISFGFSLLLDPQIFTKK